MDLLKQLSLDKSNLGTYLGRDGWNASKDGALITSINPANGQEIAHIQCCDHADYEKVIHNSRDFQRQWQCIPAPQRGDIIRQISNALRDKKDALGSLVSLEMGKIKQEGDGEVQEMIDIADFAVGQSRMMYGKTMHSERPFHRMYEQWHPLGCVAVISAFNFPVAVWAWNAFIAAITGNTVIWKPSSKTALCALAVQKICNSVTEALGYADLFTLFIPSDHTLLHRFVEDTRIPLVSFTGSSRTGKEVSHKVAARMGRSILECSGNNAVIIDKDADLQLAIPAVVFGAVGTAGQRCTTTRRLFVHENIYHDVLNKLINAYSQVKVGDPLDATTLMGPLIDDHAVEQYLLSIKTIEDSGGDIVYGGKRIRNSGYFVEPTIVTLEEQTPIVKQETFAPILYVLKYQQIEHAVDMHNAVKQGLSSSLFTNSVRVAEYFLSAAGSDCGIANINIGTSGAEIGGAFGGEKETGGGREAGSDCWKQYMRRQTNTINWGQDLPLAQGIEFKLDG